VDFFSILEALRQHKRVVIPVVLLTLIGVIYVMTSTPTMYQSKADLLLTNPPAPPTAVEIAQDPALAKANNPYANMGNLTYVADVLTTLVTSPATSQSLENEGVSAGYTVAVDTSGQSSGQTMSPPAVDITGVGSTPQAAIQSAKLVTAAVSSALYKLQESQHVESEFMITTVQYVAPSTASKASSGKIKTAAGIAVGGLLVLLLAVSAAQALAQRKRGRQRQEEEADRQSGGRRGPTDSPADVPYGKPREQYETQEQYEPRQQHSEPQWSGARPAEFRPPGPARGPGMQSAGGGNRWNQNV
jgi:hypothetical protein